MICGTSQGKKKILGNGKKSVGWDREPQSWYQRNHYKHNEKSSTLQEDHLGERDGVRRKEAPRNQKTDSSKSKEEITRKGEGKKARGNAQEKEEGASLDGRPTRSDERAICNDGGVERQ